MLTPDCQHGAMFNTIPNPLVLAIALLFFPAAYFAGLGVIDMMVHVAVAIACMVLIVVVLKAPYGVAKLFGALTLWFGAEMTVLLFIGLAFGSMSVVVLAAKMVHRPINKLPFMPYAFVAFAAVFAYTPVGISVFETISA